MQQALAILSITFPIFGVVAIGYGVTARGLFRAGDLPVLGRFVLNVALPALLFKAVSERSPAEVLHLDYLLVYALGGFATVAVGWAWLTLAGQGPARRAIGTLGMSCPNSGYVGYPVLLLAMPDTATLVLAMNLIVENFLLLPLGILLLDAARPGQGRPLHLAVAQTALGVLRRPFVMAILAGMAVAALGIPIPAAVSRLTGVLAAATAGLALFVIGGTLVGVPLRGNWRFPAQVAAGKLVLNPLLVALAAAAVPAFGVPALSPEMRDAVILTAAMPMLGIYAIIAQPYGHERAAAIAMLIATSAAFVTVSLLLGVLA
jgi:predicted permease